ncbi:unnamed protein product [Moneuplotes crassus]|uniref:Uncharacterized protein n=1 Tax=Euplotes crassus TaxID=5936 RepID=A0AAD1UFK8_EUPCR|nr:unnamed protein product [Moneuplotes crassus]
MRRKRFHEPSEGDLLEEENWELKIFHHIISENNPMTWYTTKDYYWHLGDYSALNQKFYKIAPPTRSCYELSFGNTRYNTQKDLARILCKLKRSEVDILEICHSNKKRKFPLKQLFIPRQNIFENVTLKCSFSTMTFSEKNLIRVLVFLRNTRKVKFYECSLNEVSKSHCPLPYPKIQKLIFNNCLDNDGNDLNYENPVAIQILKFVKILDLDKSLLSVGFEPNFSNYSKVLVQQQVEIDHQKIL